MELVFLVIHGVGLALDFLSFVLDLNFWLVSTLLKIIIWAITFVLNLPNLIVNGLVHCCNTAFLSGIYMSDTLCCSIVGSIHVLANMFRSFIAGLESLKVIGHLTSHVVLRSKEVVHKGFMNLVLSGQSVLRQTCDVCAIIMSLIAYFVNSLVNMCLIGTQNLFSITIALWDSIVGPFLRFTEIVTTFLSHISSSAIALAILFWTPCQLAFEFLFSATKVFINIFVLNVYGLILLLLIIAVSVLIVNPALSWRIVDLISSYFTTVPSFQRLWGEVQRLHRVVLFSFHVVISLDIWGRISTAVRMTNWNGAQNAATQHVHQGEQEAEQETHAAHQGLPAAANQGRQIAPAFNQGDPAANFGNPALNPGGGSGLHGRRAMHAVNRQQHIRGIDGPHSAATEQVANAHTSSGRSVTAPVSHSLQESCEKPGTSQEKLLKNDSDKNEKLDPAHNPWKLLKEQEERKMCVICQDHLKTVLLLPCRHLCLCSDCTKILLQQPVHQRNCPLCRQMILQTLNVYL